MILPPPPVLSELPAGYKIRAGLSHSTVYADFDFETYSPAGFVRKKDGRLYAPLGASKKGLPVVGMAKYTEHPEAEVLSLAYDLKDGTGKKLWVPGRSSPPFDLFNHVVKGGILEAWNCMFEYWVWKNICERLYGFPFLRLNQLRCASAKSRAFGLPGSLEAAGDVLKTTIQKDKNGKRLLNKFSIPRVPTRTDPSLRHHPFDFREEGELLYKYNLQDIQAEAEISSLVPDLNDFELQFWQCDQRINARGVYIDIPSIKNFIKIIQQAHDKYNKRLRALTNNEVQSASEIQKLTRWVNLQGVACNSLDADSLASMLSNPHLLTPAVLEALQIREAIGSASVKKVYAMLNQVTQDNRLHDLFNYHSARTGRAAGNGPQPQNLPNKGPNIIKCLSCKRHSAFDDCPWCGKFNIDALSIKWDKYAVEDALEIIANGNLGLLEYIFKNAMDVLSGCIRALFIAAPGHDFICSDYSAIEAVVLAALAGEEWRMEVFRTHGKIYEMSASKITGISFEELSTHEERTGSHHPMRSQVGKVAELASGYQGWIGAWKQFGADAFFSDEEIKRAILAWRAASPMIVKMWSGLEYAAKSAVANPGSLQTYRDIKYLVQQDVLYCTLPSGRHLTYHNPRLIFSERSQDGQQICFETWNTNPKYGPPGWVRMETYGGKLTENVVQAVARDILAHAIVNLEAKGYPVVLHIHDEIVAEVKCDQGSTEEFERIMNTLPPWCATWPIKARGGWRDKRYRK